MLLGQISRKILRFPPPLAVVAPHKCAIYNVAAHRPQIVRGYAPNAEDRAPPGRFHETETIPLPSQDHAVLATHEDRAAFKAEHPPKVARAAGLYPAPTLSVEAENQWPGAVTRVRADRPDVVGAAAPYRDQRGGKTGIDYRPASRLVNRRVAASAGCCGQCRGNRYDQDPQRPFGGRADIPNPASGTPRGEAHNCSWENRWVQCAELIRVSGTLVAAAAAPVEESDLRRRWCGPGPTCDRMNTPRRS